MSSRRRDGPLDAMSLAVVGHRLAAIAEAMGEALVRSAFSPNIKERRDCSTAIFDSAGELLAQAEHIPIHLGSMLGVVRSVLDRFGREGLNRGDAFVANDPYTGGGTHLPDVTVVSPFFHDGQLECFTANVAHHADIGAAVPGGISGDAPSIDEEGLRLGPTRLAAAGDVCREVVELFTARCRMPDQRVLDLTGQLAANRVGSAGLALLYEAYGPRAVRSAASQLLAATEARLRAAIRAVPDGRYCAEDSVEGLSGEGLIPVRVAVEIEGDRLRLDLAGSGPASRGAINVPRNATLATAHYAVKAALDPGLPSNAGLHRCLEVRTPPGSLVDARPPRAVGARTDTCQVIAGCIIRALAKALPGRLPAPGNDASTAIVLAGVDPSDGREYVYVEAVAGGAGARADADGLDGVQVHVTNTSNLPVEVLEHSYPLLVEKYEFAPGSGGDGTFRGGLGLVRVIRIARGSASVSAHGDRHQHPAPGAEGGCPGGLGRFLVTYPDGSRRRLPSKVSGVDLPEGSRVEVRTPGGGGYGPPGRRSARASEEDRANGLTPSEPEPEPGDGGPSGEVDRHRRP